MAIYAIGDVQGCDAELCALLDRLGPVRGRDELWFVGDLVNRGPRSLEVLRRVRDLGDQAIVTLGNHDLHLLACALAGDPPVAAGDLHAVLSAPDRDELIDWLRRRPLAHYRPDLNSLLVHAGAAPAWNPLQTVKLAREVSDCLQGEAAGEFLRSMYGAQPDRWDDGLEGTDRLRCITNCLTRIRFCSADGRLDFDSKGPPDQPPPGLLPWFEVPGRATAAVRVIFGHWSALGLLLRENLLGLDTGCVWGGQLTAARIDGPLRLVSVASPGYRAIGD
ncbi:MAG: symmetrical bis(5'-nucleosyl)-tetraphosphatase [Gammaproteobacteria bacterium]|nr:MAG: symmetrical bis(5'-nucleosyl)-tetraphosphatase [Gammaproteobacteria bacterium]